MTVSDTACTTPTPRSNKALALAGRSEIRDFVDVLHLDDTYLSLGALAWAGCGKDPGFNSLW